MRSTQSSEPASVGSPKPIKAIPMVIAGDGASSVYPELLNKKSVALVLGISDELLARIIDNPAEFIKPFPAPFSLFGRPRWRTRDVLAWIDIMASSGMNALRALDTSSSDIGLAMKLSGQALN